MYSERHFYHFPTLTDGVHQLCFEFLPGYMVHHRSKVRGPVKLDRPQALMIRLQDSLDAVAVRIFHVSILRKKNGQRYIFLGEHIARYQIPPFYCEVKSWIKSTVWGREEKRKKREETTSPVGTHVTPAHQGAVWLRSPGRGTSCRCHSPEWSRRLPSAPWRRRWAGTGSCSAARSTAMGYLSSVHSQGQWRGGTLTGAWFFSRRAWESNS